MGHRVNGHPIVRAAEISPGQCDPLRAQALADNENDSERSLHDPVLEIENAEAGKGQEAQKGEQLITPLHERDVEARPIIVKPPEAGNPLSSFLIVGKVRHGGAGDPDYP